MIVQTVLAHPKADNLYDRIKERYSLTKKEMVVLKTMTILGSSNRDLGVIMQISDKTIKNHVSRILNKTATTSARELQALIFRETFTPGSVNDLDANNNHKNRNLSVLIH